jgi:hypothetical protein
MTSKYVQTTALRSTDGMVWRYIAGLALLCLALLAAFSSSLSQETKESNRWRDLYRTRCTYLFK